MPTPLPVKLRALRTQKGWTVHEAAKIIGTTPDNLSRIERGIRHPRASTLQKLANAYGIDLETLLVMELEDRGPGPFSGVSGQESVQGPGEVSDEDLRLAVEVAVHSGIGAL